MHTKRAVPLLLAVLALSAVIFTACAQQDAPAQTPRATTPSTPGRGPAPVLLQEESRIVDIVKRITPTVVAVASYDQTGDQTGLGSGFIVTSDGTILTNNHVIEGANKLLVTLPSGAEVAARSLGGNPLLDLAVLKIDRTNLPTAPIGDSDALQVGQVAIAIGNPYGFDRTVTVGVVSALRREIPGGGSALSELIQTDARIYPGNSGGPLVDSSGNVIGINTVVVGSSAGVMGFAIPINTARAIMEEARRVGHVIVPWIGISYGEITPEVASVFDLPTDQGVIVAGVEPGGPAARAGLRRGDIITQAAGRTVTSSGDLQRAIRDTAVGSRLVLRTIRNGSERTVNVTVAEMPSRLR